MKNMKEHSRGRLKEFAKVFKEAYVFFCVAITTGMMLQGAVEKLGLPEWVFVDGFWAVLALLAIRYAIKTTRECTEELAEENSIHGQEK